LRHNTGWKHLERRQRLTVIREAITAIHDPAYVQDLQDRCAARRVLDAGHDTIGSTANASVQSAAR